jgi:DNA repair protein RecN (Recombination protein N)
MQIDELNSNQDVRLQQQELLGHQLKELENAVLLQDELDSIESNFKTSANATTLIEKTSSVLAQLENDTGINAQMLSLNHELSQALEMDGKLTQVVELLSGAQVQTQESIYELTHYLNGLSVDEQSASELEERLSEFHDLARKHNCQIPELLSIQEKIQAQLSEIGSGTNTIDGLNTERFQLENNYQKIAQQLTKARTKKAKELSDLVTRSMQVLGMPGSEFMVDLTPKTGGVSFNGVETVDFLVKTNMGQDFKALKKIASGGELSRISLAVSVVSSDSEYTPTLIFDEVDVGISGAVAEVVGQKLKELSEHYQVVCITHLAQVASFGHQHLRVSKLQKDIGAQTTVEQLSDTDRISEIARILSGTVVSDKARKAAAEMITKSA